MGRPVPVVEAAETLDAVELRRRCAHLSRRLRLSAGAGLLADFDRRHGAAVALEDRVERLVALMDLHDRLVALVRAAGVAGAGSPVLAEGLVARWRAEIEIEEGT